MGINSLGWTLVTTDPRLQIIETKSRARRTQDFKAASQEELAESSCQCLIHSDVRSTESRSGELLSYRYGGQDD